MVIFSTLPHTSQANLTNRVWNSDPKTQQWNVSDAGNGDQALDAVVAFDVENQVGWYYGYYIPDDYSNVLIEATMKSDMRPCQFKGWKVNSWSKEIVDWTINWRMQKGSNFYK